MSAVWGAIASQAADWGGTIYQLAESDPLVLMLHQLELLLFLTVHMFGLRCCPIVPFLGLVPLEHLLLVLLSLLLLISDLILQLLSLLLAFDELFRSSPVANLLRSWLLVWTTARQPSSRVLSRRLGNTRSSG